MTDQERNLRAALNAQRFSEEVARQVAQHRADRVEWSIAAAAERQRQEQQRLTFGGA